MSTHTKISVYWRDPFGWSKWFFVFGSTIEESHNTVRRSMPFLIDLIKSTWCRFAKDWQYIWTGTSRILGSTLPTSKCKCCNWCRGLRNHYVFCNSKSLPATIKWNRYFQTLSISKIWFDWLDYLSS